MTQYFQHRNLLSIKGLSAEEITFLLDRADYYFKANRNQRKGSTLLAGLTQFNLFFENSTRTLMSFEVAGKRLGMDVVAFGAATSSLKKGETLIDTALTLNAMRPAVMVIRHARAGAVSDIASHVSCAVINAGDGNHEHPTQALLDAAIMRQHAGALDGLEVAICGDIAHSRVAGSNIELLKIMGANVRAIGPAELMPQNLGIPVTNDMSEGLEGADVVMMLRVQKERLKDTAIPSDAEYFETFGLNRKRLAAAKPGAIVMHPGPMNRGVEIADDVADDPDRSVILEQVEMGVAVRMAVLDALLSGQNGGTG